MSQAIGREQWGLHRRAFEGHAEDLLIGQQKLFRLAQALSKNDFDTAHRLFEDGAALDIPLRFEESDGAVPGAQRFRHEQLQDLGLPCATLLAIFAARGHHEVVAWLLDRSANPQQVFANNRDAAWIAMSAQQIHSHGVLLNAGALPNLRLSDGSRTTRLMAAVQTSNPILVEQIMARHADPTAFDSRGRTPLHLNFAMNPYTDNDMAIAAILLAAGANPNVEDLSGQPPHALATDPAAHAAMEGHELRHGVDLVLAQSKQEMADALDASTPPARDPADPDTPQIQRPPQKFHPKPPRL